MERAHKGIVRGQLRKHVVGDHDHADIGHLGWMRCSGCFTSGSGRSDVVTRGRGFGLCGSGLLRLMLEVERLDNTPHHGQRMGKRAGRFHCRFVWGVICPIKSSRWKIWADVTATFWKRRSYCNVGRQFVWYLNRIRTLGTTNVAFVGSGTSPRINWQSEWLPISLCIAALNGRVNLRLRMFWSTSQLHRSFLIDTVCLCRTKLHKQVRWWQQQSSMGFLYSAGDTWSLET